MWFKNARIYKVELDNNLKDMFKNETLLEERVSALRFKGLGESEIAAFGFAPVLGRKSEAYSFSFSGNHFFKFVESNKLLPSTIVNQALLDEIDIRENELNRPLKKAEKDALKQGLLQKMLAQAFATRKETYIWVNSNDGFVAVSASSAKKAENAIALLRKALGSLPAKPFQPRCVVEDRLTNYIENKPNIPSMPENLSLGYETVLKSMNDDGGVVRISKEDLTAEETLTHINAGKVVTQIQLSYKDSFSFIIANDLSIKRIAIEDQYLEKNLPPKSDDILADVQGMLVIEGDILNQLANYIKQMFECD